MNTAAFYEFWRAWFAQPEGDKLACLRQPGRGGFYPARSESPGFTGRPDPKEYFHVRTGHLGAEGYCLDLPTAHVFSACYVRARTWLYERGLLEALNFAPEECVLRVLHYFPTADGHVGEAHRDFDLLTVSVPGTVPGLERIAWDGPCPATGEPPPGACACMEGVAGEGCAGDWVSAEGGIQVGEMLEIFTAHQAGPLAAGKLYLPTTTHRVRIPPNTERFSAAFFYLPSRGFELRPGYTEGDYLREALTKAGTYSVGVKP